MSHPGGIAIYNSIFSLVLLGVAGFLWRYGLFQQNSKGWEGGCFFELEQSPPALTWVPGKLRLNVCRLDGFLICGRMSVSPRTFKISCWPLT